MTQYDDIFMMFKDNITDPDLLKFSSDLQNDFLISLMSRAITKCKRICKDVDLSNRDDIVMEFGVDVPDEVTDIITEWMTVFWLKPYVNNVENLRNHLSTSDFKLICSPANLLDKISNRYELARKHAKSLTNEYSYIHSDMTRLKS